jgi:hypothetical protein
MEERQSLVLEVGGLCDASYGTPAFGGTPCMVITAHKHCAGTDDELTFVRQMHAAVSDYLAAIQTRDQASEQAGERGPGEVPGQLLLVDGAPL